MVIPEQLPEEEAVESKPLSKSARVREYLKEHPNARNKEVAKILSQYGVRPADVANVKAILKKKAELNPVAQTEPPSSAPSSNAASAMIDASVQLDLLENGIEFVRKAGGVNEALHVLGVIRRIRSLS